jgi:hypothetical protein
MAGDLSHQLSSLFVDLLQLFDETGGDQKAEPLAALEMVAAYLKPTREGIPLHTLSAWHQTLT